MGMRDNYYVNSTDGLPSNTQLLLPLLALIEDSGGAAKPGEIYERLAAQFDLPDEARNATVRYGERECNAFERRVRWVRQTAVCKGFLGKPRRGLWELTERGNATLRNARRGTIVTIFETEHGFALWANAEEAVGIIEPGSLDLIVTSPPYPLLKKKEYGNLPAREWIDWMLRLCESWRDLLSETGSLMLNVGPTWNPGVPTQSTYIERLIIALEDQLGYHLCERLYWQNTTKLPQPREWVAVRRVRVTPSVEHVLWLSPTPTPKADNRRVLRPYSARTRAQLNRGTERRPSGLDVNAISFARDNGGSIPPDLLRISNSAANTTYRRRLRELGMPAHPATFPEALAEFAILLCTEPGDVCADFFFGSGTLGAVCERLDRKWIGVERSLTYLRSSQVRFPKARSVA